MISVNNLMKKKLYKANGRGTTKLNWLDSKHSFSFGEYYDPSNTHFGALRVLNDDIIEPGMGFGTHPHNNMEIITIVLEGVLEHKDNMGSIQIMKKDDVQVMSAGSGIFHSEYNHSKDENVNLLQLWIFPDKKNVKPSYDQSSFPLSERSDQLKIVASGENITESLYINQKAKVILGNMTTIKNLNYKIEAENGLYVFLIDGSLKIGDIKLEKRDAVSIEEVESIEILSESKSNFLLIDVPMN